MYLDKKIYFDIKKLTRSAELAADVTTVELELETDVWRLAVDRVISVDKYPDVAGLGLPLGVESGLCERGYHWHLKHQRQASLNKAITKDVHVQFKNSLKTAMSLSK